MPANLPIAGSVCCSIGELAYLLRHRTGIYLLVLSRGSLKVPGILWSGEAGLKQFKDSTGTELVL